MRGIGYLFCQTRDLETRYCIYSADSQRKSEMLKLQCDNVQYHYLFHNERIFFLLLFFKAS